MVTVAYGASFERTIENDQGRNNEGTIKGTDHQDCQ